MKQNDYDAIVIGAGPGGATIGSLLANDGKRILLIDKNASAGGKMTTFHKDGHTYEMFPLNLIPYAPSLFEKLAEVTGKTDKVRNVAAEFKGDQVNILYHDRNDKVHLLDSGNLSSFKSLKMGLGDMMRSVLAVGKMLLMSDKGLKKLEKISALDYMNSLKIPEVTKIFITAAFGEGAFEMSSDMVPASHMIRAFRLSINKKKYPTPRYYQGGVGGFFTTMVETVVENGGSILWKTRVKSIDIKDGKAIGVTTEKGEKFTAPLIISNAGLRQTVFKLVGEKHFPKEYAKRIQGLHSNLADVGWRYFTSQKVLDFSTYVYFPYNCLEPWSVFEEMKDGKRKPLSNYIYIGTKSVYPTISPSDKQVIYAVMSCHPDPKQDLTPYLEYIETKLKLLFPKLFTDGVIERKEVMGLKEVSVLGVDAIFAGQGGESYGIANSIGQSDGDRPTCDLPIPGLYSVGNDTEGFGVGTHRACESGFLTYQKITGNKII